MSEGRRKLIERWVGRGVVVWRVKTENQRGRGLKVHMYCPWFFIPKKLRWEVAELCKANARKVP